VVIKGDVTKDPEWFRRVLGPGAMDYIGGVNSELRYMTEEEKKAWCERENARFDRAYAGEIMAREEQAKHKRVLELCESLNGREVDSVAESICGRKEVEFAMDASGIKNSASGRPALVGSGVVDRNGNATFDSVDELCASCAHALTSKQTIGNVVENEKMAMAADKILDGRFEDGTKGAVSCKTVEKGHRAVDGTKAKPGSKKKKPKTDSSQNNDRLSHRVTKLTDKWKKEAENTTGTTSKGKTGKKVDFVMNEKGELCVRFWEKAPAGNENEWISSGKTEKCLDVKPLGGTGNETKQDTMAALREAGLLKDGTHDMNKGKQSTDAEKETNADRAPSPEVISQMLGLDEDDLSDIDSDPKLEEIWCMICIRFDRASYVSYICIECTGRFCADCAWRHERGIKEHTLQRGCSFHLFHVSLPMNIQCKGCAAVATHVMPLTKQKTKILGAKGWRSDRFNSTEACDKKIRQLQDKQVIQFCKKKFNLDSTEQVRVREHDDILRMREREREQMMFVREQEEILRMRKREDLVRMRNVQMEMRIREQEEEMRIRQCDNEIEEHDRQLQETMASLKAIEEKKTALVRRKEAIIEGKEEFIRDLDAHNQQIDVSISYITF
jgi:hypothetical protein